MSERKRSDLLLLEDEEPEAKTPGEVPPPVPVRADWPMDVCAHYLQLRARGTGYDKSWALVKAAFPDEKLPKKRPGSLPLWEAREAADYLAWHRTRIKEDLKKIPFAQKWERVQGLSELAGAQLSRFDIEDAKGEGASHTVLTHLSREIRSCFSEIHAQVEGAGLDDAAVDSIIEAMVRKRRRMMAESKRAAEMLEVEN